MKSYCSNGLILMVSLGWATSAALAQSDADIPSLMPLPSVAPVVSSSVPAGYYSNSAPGQSLSSLTGSSLDPLSNAPAAPTAPAMNGATGSDFENAVRSNCWNDCDTCNTCCGATWFGSAGGLVMGRNRANPYWTTFQTNNNVNQLLNTQDAGANWTGGGQVTVGRMSCCSGVGVAFTYWGLGQMTATASISDPNNLLSTPINLNAQGGPVLIGSTPAASFFDNSSEHRIARNDRVNNFEINMLTTNLVNCGRLQLTGLAGFRYFRFDERLSFGAAAGGFAFGSNGGANEAYMAFRCTNNLFGGQFGANMNYAVTQQLGIFVTPKAGIYANQMNTRSQLYSGDGQQGFDIGAHKVDASFLGEIDSGFTWAFTPNLRAYMGYRVLGVSGLALSDNQFLPFLADQAGFGQVKQNGSLILHGAFGGLAWSF